MVATSVQIGALPAWVTPIGAPHPEPPGCRWRSAGNVGVVGGDGEVEHGRGTVPLRLGAVSGVIDERREGVVGYHGRVDPESVEVHLVTGRLAVVGIAVT